MLSLAKVGRGLRRAFAPAAPLAAPTGPAKTIELRPAERKGAARDKAPMALLPGAKVDDFEIVRLLGRGAFGHVYLARQLSLDRLVALKISANRGSEGRTMARLEHQHIVQVFSEKVDPDFNQRLLCMQLVPGIGLDKLIGMLHAKNAGARRRAAGSEPELQLQSPPRSHWTGAELLGDSSITRARCRRRSILRRCTIAKRSGKMDAVEATAWFGARLAEALDFAHRHGVLHRDIKPANILVNPYGRPMLADFNISSQPVGSESSGDEMFGGTFAYMAPEHLDAFNPGDPTGHEAVTRAVGHVFAGPRAAATAGRPDGVSAVRSQSEDGRHAAGDGRSNARQQAPICKPGLPGARMTLERTIGRCLEPEPEDRFESGAELAEQLDGCRHLREAERQAAAVAGDVFARFCGGRFCGWCCSWSCRRSPAASSTSRTTRRKSSASLTRAQQEQFMRLVAGYNAIVYPIAIVVFVMVVRRVWRVLERAGDGGAHSGGRSADRAATGACNCRDLSPG